MTGGTLVGVKSARIIREYDELNSMYTKVVI